MLATLERPPRAAPSPPNAASTLRTVAALADLFGDIPLDRIVLDPAPGTATAEDIDRVKRNTGRVCELIDGTLIERAVSAETDLMGFKLGALLLAFVESRGLGWVLGGQGFLRLSGSRVRAADVAFVRYEQVEGDRFPSEPAYPDLYPDLAIEVLSPSNTAREMRQKRTDCFAAGTSLVWEIDPATATAAVYTSVDEPDEAIGVDGVLNGRDVLPGFSVPLRDVLNAVRKTTPQP